MADTKISAMTAATVINDADVVPIVQSGNKKAAFSLWKSVLKTYFDTVYAAIGAGGSNITASSVAYAATVTPAIATTDTTILNIAAMTGALTIANPTGTAAEGKRLIIRLLQDATGGRVITWGANLVFGSDIPSSLMPTDANAAWEVVFQYNTTATKYRCVGIARGF